MGLCSFPFWRHLPKSVRTAIAKAGRMIARILFDLVTQTRFFDRSHCAAIMFGSLVRELENRPRQVGLSTTTRLADGVWDWSRRSVEESESPRCGWVGRYMPATTLVKSFLKTLL